MREGSSRTVRDCTPTMIRKSWPLCTLYPSLDNTGGKFTVKIDHNSFRYFLEQKDLNERQQKWVSKIQAYNFDI